jgi:hypothetical protein
MKCRILEADKGIHKESGGKTMGTVGAKALRLTKSGELEAQQGLSRNVALMRPEMWLEPQRHRKKCGFVVEGGEQPLKVLEQAEVFPEKNQGWRDLLLPFGQDSSSFNSIS